MTFKDLCRFEELYKIWLVASQFEEVMDQLDHTNLSKFKADVVGKLFQGQDFKAECFDYAVENIGPTFWAI
jgi:hypothetical protein